ncbi:hypothetical protein BH23CHL4_BH23CHL4_04030 [soil metagenome]
MGMAFRPHILVVPSVCIALLLIASSCSRDALGQATPGATPMASCVGAANVVGTPAPALSEQAVRRLTLVLATENLIRCWNSQDWEALVTLIRPQLLESQYGSADPVISGESMRKLHDAGFFEPIDVKTLGEPIASIAFGSIHLTVQVGYVLHRQEWHFALEQDAWLLTGIVESPPLFDVNAVGIPLTLDDNGVSAFRTHLVNPGVVVFDLVNTLDQATTFAIFEASAISGVDVQTGLIQGETPDPDTVIGWTEAAAGATISMALADLPAGSYLIVAGYDPRLEIEPLDPSAMVQITIEE